MSFHGRAPDESTDKPVRAFTYQTRAGHQRHVEAHYVQFMPGHVSFWLDTTAEFDVLVLAEANEDCNHLEERDSEALKRN